jgi:hypothetical protein
LSFAYLYLPFPPHCADRHQPQQSVYIVTDEVGNVFAYRLLPAEFHTVKLAISQFRPEFFPGFGLPLSEFTG